MRILQHVCAPNDRNGNPRRLWVTSDDSGNIVYVHEEGYRGRPVDCDYRRRPGLVEIYEISVPVWQYNELKRYARKRKIYSAG